MLFTPEAFNYFQHDGPETIIPYPHFFKWSATAAALATARDIFDAAARDLNYSMLRTEQEIRHYFWECSTADCDHARALKQHHPTHLGTTPTRPPLAARLAAPAR
ncbi:MAG: hypothetical protein Q3976_09120 [Corynebacterium sp.]|nr:hypothetical protein [Corynebacterium sp.]